MSEMSPDIGRSADLPRAPSRVGNRKRVTNESNVVVRVDLDTQGTPKCSTGLPFFDHMLCQLGRHGGFDLEIEASGDLAVDAHHSVEDVGLTLGSAFADALGDKAGIRRFASLSVPLDESVVDVALDLSGRPFLYYDIDFAPETTPLGSPGFDPQLGEEFWRAFATTSQITLHIALRYGKNTHHILEASFKAVARALRDAIRYEGGGIPSTKGTL